MLLQTLSEKESYCGRTVRILRGGETNPALALCGLNLGLICEKDVKLACEKEREN